MGVYIPGGYATQGPCPNGFHVPTKDDLTVLFNIGVNLGIWSATSGGNNLLQYLLLPLAGQLGPNGEPRLQNDSTYYMSCSQYDNNNCYCIGRVSDTDVRTNTFTFKGIGIPIRPFKDTPVTPDSTWTTLYSDKIYHNSTLGLISLSSDGSTWITISDKNLGATQVWNYGDTLSQNNCGNFYQRGNNYGFPFTGATTTSSTKVDASTYGPGNYYSSSTFIMYTYGDWSSVTNANLRGGEDGNVPVQKELKNAYIGEYVATGIYHNATLGLISLSSDGSNWLTMADKNLGATQVYNYGDTLSEANCGKYYQRGNNYGFAWTGRVQNDTTTINASTYGPGNYYSGSTFIRQAVWENSNNANLRGGTTGTNAAMQGPCASDYHVPTKTEWEAVKSIWTSLGLGADDGTDFSTKLKLPFAGYRQYANAAVADQGTYGMYWHSIRDNNYAYKVQLSSGAITQSTANSIGFGHSIRPFANTPAKPDGSWTILYQPN